MERKTTYMAQFVSPGSFVANYQSVQVPLPEIRWVAWPDNAYALQFLEERTIVDDDGTVYRAESKKLGKLVYHQDSYVQSYDEAKANPNATDILLDNMRINRWPQIIWSRWGNWPQRFDPETMEILKRS